MGRTRTGPLWTILSHTRHIAATVLPRSIKHKLRSCVVYGKNWWLVCIYNFKMCDEKLDERVWKYPAIYKVNHPKYFDNNFKSSLWKGISDEIKEPGE